MSDVLSNWMANTLLGYVPPGCYLACFQSDPTPLGSTGSEVAGGGYVRQPISFFAPSNRTIVSSNGQIFAGMPVVIVAYLGVMTAIGGGHLVFSKQLPSALRVAASGQVIVQPGDVALSL